MNAMTQENRRSYMLDTPLYRLIPKMALPTIAGMLVTSLYNLADTFFVSKLGTNATGAVGVNSSIDYIIMMGGFFIAAGAASYTSRLLGAKENIRASRVLSTGFFTAVTLGILVLIFGSLFMDPLLRGLGAIDDLMPYSRDYARYVLLAAPFMAGSFVLNHNLRAEGSAIYSMAGMMSGAFLNIALDPIFIFGLNLGVAGASMATAISKFVSFSILLLPYLRRRTTMQISLRSFGVRAADAWEVMKMGSPSLFRNCLTTVAAIVLNRMAGAHGSSAIAAISVANRITMLLAAACFGFGQGFQPIVGFSWGARRYDRIVDGYRFAAVATAVGITIPSLVLFIFAKQALMLFTETDLDLVAVGMFSLRTQCVAMPIHAFCIVVNFMCAGMGRAGGAALLGLSRQGICFFPILFPLFRLFGVWGLAGAQATADILSVALALPIAVFILRDLRRRMAAQESAAEPGDLSAPGEIMVDI